MHRMLSRLKIAVFIAGFFIQCKNVDSFIGWRGAIRANLFDLEEFSACSQPDFEQVPCWQFYAEILFAFFPFADNSTCSVEINGKWLAKSIGDVWNSAEDLCQKYTCEMGADGEALEKSFREYCMHSCHNVRFRIYSRFETRKIIYLIFVLATGLRFGAEEGTMLRWMCEETLFDEQRNISNRRHVEEWRSMHILRMQCRCRNNVVQEIVSKRTELSDASTDDQRLLHVLWIGIATS